MVSPRARPNPSITAPTTPPLLDGSTAMRIISHRVAPSARAASRLACGTCRKTSREMAATIGSIMIASTTEAAKTDLPKVSGRVGEERDEAEVAVQNTSNGSVADEEVHAPQAVDDAGHGGEQVDQIADPRADLLGANSVSDSAAPIATGTTITSASRLDSTVPNARAATPNLEAWHRGTTPAR